MFYAPSLTSKCVAPICHYQMSFLFLFCFDEQNWRKLRCFRCYRRQKLPPSTISVRVCACV